MDYFSRDNALSDMKRQDPLSKSSKPFPVDFGQKWAEKMAKQTKPLPISSNHKQPCLIKGGQSYVGGGQKRVRAGYIPTEHPTYCLGFYWKHYKLLAL